MAALDDETRALITREVWRVLAKVVGRDAPPAYKSTKISEENIVAALRPGAEAVLTNGVRELLANSILEAAKDPRVIAAIIVEITKLQITGFGHD